MLQVILFKGFSMLTNLGYEVAVPQRPGELILAILAQNVKVIIDAYILGTLFHYLVKKGAGRPCCMPWIAASASDTPGEACGPLRKQRLHRHVLAGDCGAQRGYLLGAQESAVYLRSREGPCLQTPRSRQQRS